MAGMRGVAENAMVIVDGACLVVSENHHQRREIAGVCAAMVNAFSSSQPDCAMHQSLSCAYDA